MAAPDRLREVVLRDAAPADRSEQEIAGYRDALALIHGSADHMPVSVNVIQQAGVARGPARSVPVAGVLRGVLLRAYGEFRDRAGRLMTARGSKTALVEGAVERRIRPFAISDIENDCPGVSRDMIRHVLRRMRDEGRVQVRGRGRGARWEVIEDQSGARAGCVDEADRTGHQSG